MNKVDPAEKKFPDSISMDNETKYMLEDMSVDARTLKSKYIRALIAKDYNSGGKVAKSLLKEFEELK